MDTRAPDQRPETGHYETAVPIARRLAHTTRFFPLWWRGSTADERMPMVGWFDPGQLFSTGFKSVVSLFVGEQSDRRIVQALASRRHEYYDHSIHYTEGRRGPIPRKDRPRDELWLDFITAGTRRMPWPMPRRSAR
jgi:hypothetical protein